MRSGKSSPPLSAFLITGISGLIGLTAGFAELLIFSGLAGMITSLYQLVRGRALLPKMGIASTLLAVPLSFIVLVLGGVLADPVTPDDAAAEPTSQVTTESPSPSPAPTSTPSPTPATPAPAAADVDADGETGDVVGQEETVVDQTGAANQTGATQTALAVLDLLEVKGRAPKTGYDRKLFNYRGVDLDRNGCDTRNDILQRDLTDITFKPGSNDCAVQTGMLTDPYSGTEISFNRDAPNEVQIDHVVALMDAWQKGAQSWDAAKLERFGNDPLNLFAVEGRLNSQKGAGDAATWLPPNKAFRCEYVARQVAVKYEYGLWVTQAEKDMIAGILAKCPEQVLPSGTGGVAGAAGSVSEPVPAAEPSAEPTPAVTPAPAPKPAATPTPKATPKPVVPAVVPAPKPAATPTPAAPAATPTPPPAPAETPKPVDPVNYKNCTDVWNSIGKPITPGDPGFLPKFDRDGDGVGCENDPR